MTSSKAEPQQLKVRSIHRKQVQRNLAISAFVAVFLMSGCSNPNLPPTESPLNRKIPALFYETTAQCEADINKQQKEYSALLTAYQKKQVSTAPLAPSLRASDCAPQMLAAKREHDRHAPVYRTLADCQVDGIHCEATPIGYTPVGYRPVFGGMYLYPYGNSYVSSSYSSSGSSSHRIYQTRTIYRSLTAGKVVTPQGYVLGKTNSGRVSVPQYTSLTAPSRPQGHAARGTVTGRSSTGFGSTFKSTGRGGK
jgi:uncharacterized protein YgiB involved in biofilm formation